MTRFSPTTIRARGTHESGPMPPSVPWTRAAGLSRRAVALLTWFAGLALTLGGSLAEPDAARAQVATDASRTSETRSLGGRITNPGGPAEGWSARAGIGFTGNPSTFLLNFEAPYAFNPWVALGPMIQVGLDDDYTITAPTLNATVKFPDFLGPAFDRVVPYALGGLGLAVIENEDAPNDKRSVGFLIDFGLGVEYQLSDRLFVGTQMMFDIMPKQTQGQKFIYAWQIGGLRYAF